MLKKTLYYLLLPLAAICMISLGFVLYVERMPISPIHKMTSPVWANPAIVAPGQEFDIVIKTENKPRIERMILHNTAAPNDLELSAKIGKIIFDKKDSVTKIRAFIPQGVPESLYDLSIWYEDGKQVLVENQPGSVKVSEPEQGTFTFAVLSGFAFRDNMESRSAKREKARRMATELNVMNPDFIVLTDGAAESARTANMDAVELYRLFKDNLTVPLFVVPNDNDTARLTALGMPARDGRKAWSKVFGKSHFAFEHEGFFFAGIDTTGCIGTRSLLQAAHPAPGCIKKSELDFLDAQLTTARSHNLTPIVFMHHSPLLSFWTDDRGMRTALFEEHSKNRLLNILKKHSVQAVFSGHLQKNTVAWRHNILFVTTGAGPEPGKPESSALRLATVVRGRLQYKYISYVRSPNTVPPGKVSAISRKANSATSESNTFVLSNGLRRPLNNVAATAIMKKISPDEQYEVTGADRQTQSVGRHANYVFIKCDLKPGEKRIVNISRKISTPKKEKHN